MIHVIILMLALCTSALGTELAEIKSRGELRHLGVRYANFVTGGGDGFDVELMSGFAKSLGVKYTLVYSDFYNVIRDLIGNDVVRKGANVYVLTKEIHRAQRNKSSISLLMIDVDFFKLYNDYYGHVSGDHCLASIASAIARVAGHRASDVAVRYGGEEFAVVLPDTQLIGAKKVSENILAEVRSLALPNQQSSVAKIVTVSIGYTCYHSQEVITPEQLVAITDAELYKAKHSGRNCAIGQQYEVA